MLGSYSLKDRVRKAPRAAAFLILAALSLLLTLQPLTAYAAEQSIPPQWVSDSQIAEIPWTDSMKTYADQNGVVDPDFNPEDESLKIVVFTHDVYSPEHYAMYRYGFIYTRTGTLTLKTQTTNGKKYNIIAATGGNIYHGEIVTPTSIAMSGGCSGLVRGIPCERGYVLSNNRQTISPSNSNQPFGASSSGSFMEFIYAKGVVYDPSWNGPNTYADELRYNTVKTKCDTLDIACHMANIWHGVTDTFKSVGRAITESIASFFMPDSDSLKATIDDFAADIHDRLGFLTLPYDFLIDLIDSFKDDAAMGWCTDSNCVKTFGNFQGEPFRINFSVVSQNFPAFWSFAVLAIRGMVVLWLLFVIRAKYLETITP